MPFGPDAASLAGGSLAASPGLIIQRCLAIFTRDFDEVFSGNVDSRYFVGPDSFFGHSIPSHSSGYDRTIG